MIKRLHLKNFKGFQQFELSDMSRVMLIGGRNNVGKTSLLEAIFLFYDLFNPGLFFRHFDWRGIQVSSVDAETLFAPIFYAFSLDQQLIIEIWDDIYQSKLEVTLNPALFQKSLSIDIPEAAKNRTQIPTSPIPSNSYALNLHYQIDGIGQEDITLAVKQSPTNLNIQFEPGPVSIFPPSMRRTSIYLPLRSKVDPQEDATRFGQLDIERKNDRILEVLRILEPQLVGLSSVSLTTRTEIYADITGINRKIPVALLGDGMSRLLSIILAIASANNGIVMIDEIDAGLHYSVLPQVWQGICQAAQTFQCQIIATTHSYECLQAAYAGVKAANMEQDFSYVRLEKQQSGVVGKHYPYSVLEAALSQGWEVR